MTSDDAANIEVGVNLPPSPASNFKDEEDTNNAEGGNNGNNDEEAVFYSTNEGHGDILPSLNLQFMDHFSLRRPSSTVRYRNKQVQIYDLVNDQLQLEHQVLVPESTNQGPEQADGGDGHGDDDKKKPSASSSTTPPSIQITMHRMRAGSIGLRLLRLIYTLVALLMFTYWLIFAAQAIAFQAMEIPKHTGKAAGQELRVGVMIATILSLPLMGYSMASLMVMAMMFVIDCWNGHIFFALLFSGLLNNHNNGLVVVEWFSFVFYIGVPICALVVTNFMKLDNWQEITYLTWYACMNFSFLCFCALIVYQEIKLCLVCTKNQFPDLSGTALITKAILTTLIQSYCAVEEHTYLVQSDQDGNNNLQPLHQERPISTYITPAGMIKRRLGFAYEVLETPQRRYAIEEMRESVPYVTNHAGWSLEHMCCKLRIGRSRFVVSGPNALGKHQYRSTLICNFLGFFLSTISIIAVAYGNGQSTMVLLVIAIILLVVIGVPLLGSAQQLVQAMPSEDYEKLLQVGGDQPAQGEDEEEDPAVAASVAAARAAATSTAFGTGGGAATAPAFYQAWSAYTVAKPKEWYCWARFGISAVLFFLWPAISLYVSGLNKAATLFLVTGIVSGVRLYLDAGSMICESGTLTYIKVSNNLEAGSTNETEADVADKKARDMTDHARAAEVMGKITNSTRTWLWYLLFLGVGAYFVWSGATSLNGEDATPQEGRETIVFVDDFYYPPQPDISYTTCELHKAYAIPGQDVTYTMDYNLLAGLGYETTSVTKHVMEKWFGPDEWVDEAEFVQQWKKDKGYELSPVSFKLFSKTNMPGVGVLSIRGTETPTDRLFNALLYSSSFLTEYARMLMPFSWIWNDIYDELIATTSWMASEQLQRIGYYQETTHFANDLLRNNYTNPNQTFPYQTYYFLRTTGVSLGGGLALITGAQSDAFGIGIAGMNPVDARRTFHPPLQMEALNTQVLNIIPETDFISNMGTKVRNFETVGCRSWPAKRYNCHSFWRIYCEYLYSCGTPPGKPAYCICVATWGYPEPEPKPGTNRTFKEACAAGDAEFRAAVPQKSDSKWLDDIPA